METGLNWHCCKQSSLHHQICFPQFWALCGRCAPPNFLVGIPHWRGLDPSLQVSATPTATIETKACRSHRRFTSVVNRLTLKWLPVHHHGVGVMRKGKVYHGVPQGSVLGPLLLTLLWWLADSKLHMGWKWNTREVCRQHNTDLHRGNHGSGCKQDEQVPGTCKWLVPQEQHGSAPKKVRGYVDKTWRFCGIVGQEVQIPQYSNR